MRRVLYALPLIAVLPLAAQPSKRALTIEDYYRIQNVGGASISPDAKWVTFTVSSRVEEDNSTSTETFVVPADASAQPSRVRHYGRDIGGARWTDDSRLQYTAEREQWSVDPARLGTPVKSAARPAAGGGGRGRGG